MTGSASGRNGSTVIKVRLITDELFPYYLFADSPKEDGWSVAYELPTDVLERYRAALTEFQQANKALEEAITAPQPPDGSA